MGEALGAEETAVEARTGFGDVQDLEEEIAIAAVAGDREPLDLVLVRVGVEAEQFGDAAVEIAEGIGRILFLLERHVRAACLPARAAAEIAAAIERQHCGLVERRGIVSRRGVREVVLHDHDAAVGKLRAQFQVQIGLRNGADDGDGVHLFGLGAGEMKAGGDGVLRHLVEAAPVGAAADEFRFFHGGDQLAVLEYRGGGIAQHAADSEDDHLDCLPRFSILAQVSFRATVRLKTGLPGAESGSTQK